MTARFITNLILLGRYTHTRTDNPVYNLFFFFLPLWVRLAFGFINLVFGMFAKDTGQVLVRRLQHQLTQTTNLQHTRVLHRETNRMRNDTVMFDRGTENTDNKRERRHGARVPETRFSW